MPDLLLGVDIGTYGAKGVVTDAAGNTVATASRDHRPSVPKPGWLEHDAEQDWWGGFVSITRELLTAPEVEAASIIGVGTSGIGPCVLPIDADHQPLRPAILYGVDTRATEQMAAFERQLGVDDIVMRCGNVLTTQSAGPKIAWIRDHEPDVYSRARAFVSSQSFLVARLTGRVTLDHGTASYFHPFYDLTAGDWYDPWLEPVVSRDRLPELGWADEVAGEVTDTAARETGLPEGTPVVFGTTDAPAEAVSAGVTAPGRTMVMYGSTIFMITVLERPAITRELWSAPYVSPGTYVLAGGTATAGTVTHWLRNLAAGADGELPSFESLAAEAAGSPPGAAGLLLLPHFSGERTPLNDPDARGAITGLDLTHTRGDVVRAALEGIAHGVQANLRSFIDHGARPQEIRAVGGGTSNVVWTQATADVTGLAQRVVAGRGASLGDAALAAVGVGVLDGLDDVDAWVTIDHDVVPRPELAELYEQQGLRVDALYGSLRSLREADVGRPEDTAGPMEVQP